MEEVVDVEVEEEVEEDLVVDEEVEEDSVVDEEVEEDSVEGEVQDEVDGEVVDLGEEEGFDMIYKAFYYFETCIYILIWL